MIEPGKYEIIARHKTPEAIIWVERLSVLSSAAICYYFLRDITAQNWGWVVFGILFGGLMLYLLLRSIFIDLPFITMRHTVIKFEHGIIRYRAGRHGWQTIGANEERNFRIDRHRFGQAEARSMQKAHSNGTRIPLYQTSSEVFIDTGEGWMHPHRVAQIAFDESGELAHKLSATMRMVDQRAAVQEVGTTKQRRGLD
ncbi:hypothetical protein ACX4MT_00075 [Roseomonas mucosa]